MLVSKVIQVLLAMTVQKFPADYLGGMVLFGKRTVLQLKITNSLQSFSSNQLFVHTVKTLYGKRQYFLTFLRKVPKGLLKSNRVRGRFVWKMIFFAKVTFQNTLKRSLFCFCLTGPVDKYVPKSKNHCFPVSMNQSKNQTVIRNCAFVSCNIFHKNFKWKKITLIHIYIHTYIHE